MDNNQFHIPSLEVQASPELIQEVESALDTPEIRELLSAFDEVKMIENRIDSYRSMATEANLPKKTRVERARDAVTNLFSTNAIPRTLHDKLVEAESTIGGSPRVLPSAPGVVNQRFWYQQGDWFYEVHDSVGPMVARYQFIDGSIAKLVDGKLVQLAEGEAETIYKIIPQYHDAISELYISKDDLGLAA